MPIANHKATRGDFYLVGILGKVGGAVTKIRHLILLLKTFLDEYSDYVLPLHPHAHIVAFEKSGLWSDGSVAVCFTNLSVKRLNTLDFEALLKNDGSQ